MRYPEGGGLTAEDRARREAVRLRAAEMSVQDVPQAEVARRLRVSPMSAGRWHRAWKAGEVAAPASKGAAGGPAGSMRNNAPIWKPNSKPAGPPTAEAISAGRRRG